MERTKKSAQSIVFIDTHILVFLFDKKLELLTKKSKDLLRNNSVYITPLVRLELQYLYEIGRIRNKPSIIIQELVETIQLQISATAYDTIVNRAMENTWTRDPFDRIIVADAQVHDAYLITADKNVQKYYEKGVV